MSDHGFSRPFDVRRRDAILYRIARITAEIIDLNDGEEREKYEEEVFDLIRDLDEIIPGWMDRTPLERKPRQRRPDAPRRDGSADRDRGERDAGPHPGRTSERRFSSRS